MSQSLEINLLVYTDAVNDYSSFICNSPRLEMTHGPISKGTCEHSVVVRKVESCSSTKGDKLPTHDDKDGSQDNHVEWTKSDGKDHILRYSLCVTFWTVEADL